MRVVYKGCGLLLSTQNHSGFIQRIFSSNKSPSILSNPPCKSCSCVFEICFIYIELTSTHQHTNIHSITVKFQSHKIFDVKAEGGNFEALGLKCGMKWKCFPCNNTRKMEIFQNLNNFFIIHNSNYKICDRELLNIWVDNPHEFSIWSHEPCPWIICPNIVWFNKVMDFISSQ